MCHLKKTSMFDINKIVNFLKRFESNIDNYAWGERLRLSGLCELGIITQDKAEEIGAMQVLERDIFLKSILSAPLIENYQTNRQLFFRICEWIIKDWGGIKSGNDQKTQTRITDFLENNIVTLHFDRIASVSKVISFMYPEKHIIYDSRVSSSINWILLAENASQKYFPIPEGRNSKLAAFDIETLIRLKHKQNYSTEDISEIKNKKFITKKDHEIFIDKSEAYQSLRNLIETVNGMLWNETSYLERRHNPFYTEMLLFSIADNYIFRDLISRTEIEIK